MGLITDTALSIVQHPAVRAGIKGLSDRLSSEAIRDAIVNSVTGLGTERSKTSWNEYQDEMPLTMEELEALFANNDLAAVIVSKIVEDSLRDGFTFGRKDADEDEDAELVRRVMDKWKKLQAGESRFQRGAIWGRLFGGGGLILAVEDGRPLEAELVDEEVTKVKYLIDTNRQELTVADWKPDGTPLAYDWIPDRKGPTTIQVTRVHASRIMLFPGATTTAKRRVLNDGWDLSVLQRVVAALKSFDTMWANTDAMFADASQAVFHMQGLIAALAEDGGGTNDVKTRLTLMDMGRSVAKSIILDAGDEDGAGREDFKVVDRASLGGLDGVQQNYMVRLATAARMPLTVLLGMAPAGMDATGESDMTLYFNTVDTYRQEVLTERVLRIIKMLIQEVRAEDGASDMRDDSEEDEPEDDEDIEWCIEWPELFRPKPLDVQTAENMRVTSATGLITSEVVTPEEVALNLSRIAPTLRMQIDLDARRKAMKAAMEEVANRETGIGKLEAEGEVSTNNSIKVEKAKPKPVAGAPKTKMSKRKTPSKAAKRQV
jgi:phage-related protein (TIGR01555 family)